MTVRPRREWAGDDHPPGSLVAEPDVRLLVVHHTVHANDYPPERVPALLRGIYAFHTGPDKGWPDIAYNFVVDRFGGVWEARAGSIEGPVRGDATGGNQGFDQKCAFLGDHRDVPPSAEAEEAMISLLAWLVDRSGLDPSGSARFVSLGSNLHPAGVEVEVPAIAGHRLVSQTTCPGDAGDAVLDERIRPALAAGPRPTSTTVAAPTTPTSAQAAPVPPRGSGNADTDLGWGAAGPVAVGAVVVGAVIALRRRRL